MARERRPNHVLHLLLSLVTGGVWLIVWLLLGMSQSPAHCAFCGSKRLQRHIPKGRFVAAGPAGSTYQPEVGHRREDGMPLGWIIVGVIVLVVIAIGLSAHLRA